MIDKLGSMLTVRHLLPSAHDGLAGKPPSSTCIAEFLKLQLAKAKLDHELYIVVVSPYIPQAPRDSALTIP